MPGPSEAGLDDMIMRADGVGRAARDRLLVIDSNAVFKAPA